MLVPALIELFLTTRAKTLKPSSIKFYAGRLKKFGLKFPTRNFAELTAPEILQYLDEVGAQHSDSTRRHNAVALESLQSFAKEMRIITSLIFEKLEKPAMGQRDRLPTPEETAALLAGCTAEFRLIYLALCHSGARPGELCGATVAHLERAKPGAPRPYVAIVLKDHKTARKTKKPRRISIGEVFWAILARALGDRTTGPIFLAPSGKAWSVDNLSRTYRKLRNAAKLPDDLVLYLARHEAGSRVCKKLGIEAARRLLGHSNTQTTTRYIHYTDDELADLQDDAAAKDESGKPKPEDKDPLAAAA